ncbi:MAG TPA: winged helix-turn-helix domain-containing protein [Candidatus Acidoferrales bacterium]|nr:winged helix-turn-helix domain-containing protein [Candidatus Acidoferrales bacterium]
MLKLERIPMEIVLLLVERRMQVVSREQIVERIWGKDVFLDTDNSINGAIRKIRQVLRDDSDEPRFIQTITGRGYRFIAPVVGIEEPQPAAVAGQDFTSLRETASTAASIRTGKNEAWTVPLARSRSRVWLGIAAFSALVIVSLAGLFMWFRSRASQPSAGKIMLAVLPFQNLTGDSSQEYFSDGLTEEMITQLANLEPQHLGVIARTSVMHYKNSQTPLDQIGRELGVQYVIEGSVRRDSNDIRVTAQLIQTKDQTHVWARQYDRELQGLLALQGEIAQEIADELQLTLGDHKSAAAPAARSPRNYDAYDLYLKGQYFFNKRTVDGFEEAIAYFQQATAKDPNYARAYAGLADSYALIPGYSMRPQAEFIPKARAAALRALEIDESLPAAHTALALIVQNYDWDWQTAEKEFRRAIELNPNYATAHQWYAEHLMWRGRFDEALEESERARQLDPLSLIIATDNGAILFFSRQYDRAIEKWRLVLDMDPNFPRAHLIRYAYVEKGMFGEALADTQAHGAELSVPWHWAYLAVIYGRSGRRIEAQHAIEELLKLNRSKAMDPKIFADAYAGLGDKDQALAWLEKAYAQHSIELVSLKVDPGYDPLRGDPRFQDLLHRVGLAN